MEEERAIQMDLFVHTRFQSRNIYAQVIANEQVLKILEDMSPFCGATDTSILDF